jgi:hypothetical protein
MHRTIRIALVGFFVFALSSAPAQAARARSEEGMPQFRGGWYPVVGAGAVYQVESPGLPSRSLEIAVVGQEAGGYWIETRTSVPEESIMKMLRVQGTPKRLIIKAAGQPAMELPATMQAQPAPGTNLKATAKLIGKEQITTPAGTFSCDHYQMSERGGMVDAWVAASVSPYGLVKMTSRDTAMTLTQVVKGAKSRITETPQKLGMPNMSSPDDQIG